MAAAALVGGASAHNHQRHAHAPFHNRAQNDTGLVCSETVETITGGDFICMLGLCIPRAPKERESLLTNTKHDRGSHS